MPASFTKKQQEEIREQLFCAGIRLIEFFREYLYSEYDLMNGLTIDDFLWLKTHMADAGLFNPVNQLESV